MRHEKKHVPVPQDLLDETELRYTTAELIAMIRQCHPEDIREGETFWTFFRGANDDLVLSIRPPAGGKNLSKAD